MDSSNVRNVARGGYTTVRDVMYNVLTIAVSYYIIEYEDVRTHKDNRGDRDVIIRNDSMTLLSTRLLPSSDSHVTKFVKQSLRSRQVYDVSISSKLNQAKGGFFLPPLSQATQSTITCNPDRCGTKPCI